MTQKGMQDARNVGKKLANIHFDAAFCSDTTRAEVTIQTILDMNQADSVKQPTTAPYFREEFYGYFEGANMDEAWYLAGAPHGLSTFKAIVEKYSIGQAKDWLKDADPFHHAENNQEYWQRVNQGLDLIRKADVPDNANILWVSHGNTLLSLMERFGKGKYDLTVRPENGSLTKLILTDDDVEVEYYNRK